MGNKHSGLDRAIKIFSQSTMRQEYERKGYNLIGCYAQISITLTRFADSAFKFTQLTIHIHEYRLRPGWSLYLGYCIKNCCSIFVKIVRIQPTTAASEVQEITQIPCTFHCFALENKQ